MDVYVERISKRRIWVYEKLFNGLSITEYTMSLFTPSNIIAGLILLIGFPFILIRYAQGLASVTNASDVYPWGLFISYGLLCGVPFASTGFLMATAHYLFGLKEYRPLVRLGILTGFLGYFFAVVFLLVDLGRPWRLPYPMFVSLGPASVLFLVAWHVALYLSTQFVEFCPSIFEWLGAERCRRWATKVTIGATIFGVILSTLHQSALGALFLLMPGKVHPLWYSPYLPVFFFISSIFAGLSVMILVSSLCRRFLRDKTNINFTANLDGLLLGLGKAASVVLFAYYSLKLVGVAHGNQWELLVTTPYGSLFLTELIFFVFLPCLLYAYGVKLRNVRIVQFTSVLTMIGVVFNRFNVSLIGFNWNLPHREIPQWKEFVIAITIITIGIFVFRWIVNRMPVLRELPEYSKYLISGKEIGKKVKPSYLRRIYGNVQYMNDSIKNWTGA